MVISNIPIHSHIALIHSPIVILAGGCDSSVQNKMDFYRSILIDSFSHFRGTILSGGTSVGIAGIAADICGTYSETITGVGYLPQGEKPDNRFDHIVYTSGQTFSLLEPIQMWNDIVLAKVNPNDVIMLGINGGKITAVEFLLASAMGANIGVIEGSGRAVDDILNNPKSMDIVTLYATVESIQGFIENL